ncbi:MAG: tRNA (adenosine(37)-N6)-threonylcarbamoyltransferase complex dimerization subunit type 1 TsaB [Acidimicrobiia bacterium]|nr:tRNA (adenosine(37)-N6)-threonylcarbamoyltransferase complex dimerization subunit type 1 TsaB [Acidimicrobiia bacterium]MDX2466842.1 tRNA (adenosine(37)-N6)-threonylcarbamoyltransferase complex dimerization subunit type 1 TsaB [Acidimicrobiia bacterium]
MKILAIDTATSASSIALGDEDQLAAMSLRVDRRGHGGFLVPAIDFAFETAGWKPSDIEVIAVDIGPGLFTGIRAGISTAQAIAAAIGAPIVTVSSLTALAVRAATGRRRIWPVVDLRRDQYATQPFQPVPGGVAPDGAAEIVTAEGLHNLLDSDAEETLMVGDVDGLPPSTLRGLHRVKRGRPRYPSADVLLEIAAMHARNGNFVMPEDVRPLYMREPDAQINWSDFRDDGVWPGADA